MKKTMKLIAMLTVITLLTGLLAVAIADDKIYTSPTFKIPKDRVVVLPDPEPETSIEEGTEPEGQPAEEQPAEEQPGEEPAPETPAEEGTEPAEQPGEEPAETENKPAEEAGPVERKVLITSSRKDTVIRDQFITLYSELIGFEGLEPHYQWQVDRGDGNGWVDVEGATGATHSFVARPDTILYNWRLIVTVDE